MTTATAPGTAPAARPTAAAPTGRLTTEPHFDDGDGFYEALIQAHQGLTDDESHAYNARLVLVLANHIGAHPVLLQALDAARLPPAG
jgi:hypothetical protein